MSDNYRVVFTGEIAPGSDLEQVIDRFSEKFKLARDTAEKVIRAGKPVSLKKDLSLEKAEKYLTVLKTVGIVVEIDPKPPEPEPVPAHSVLELEPLDHGGGDATEVLERVPGVDECPKCRSTNMEMGICQDCGIVASKYLAAQAARETESADESEAQPESTNPYSAPEADLEEAMEHEMSGPVAVSIGQGAAWIGSGWGYFKSSPLAWIGAMVVWFIISMVLGFIPFLGGIVSILIGPVITAGFMYGCSEQDAGGEFSVSHLFAGFSSNVGQLILVAVLYFIEMVVVMAVLGAIAFMLFGGIAMLEDPEAMSNVGFGTFIALFLVALLLMIPVMMTYLFAPALVMLDEFSALDAMKLSFVGCLKNIPPFIVYVLLSLVLVMIGSIPFGLGLLVVMPMLTAAIYAAYRDIYFG
jgi:uncharacterized membrane protein